MAGRHTESFDGKNGRAGVNFETHINHRTCQTYFEPCPKCLFQKLDIDKKNKQKKNTKKTDRCVT